MNGDAHLVSIPEGLPPELGIRRSTPEVLEEMGFAPGRYGDRVLIEGVRYWAALAPGGWRLGREGYVFERESVVPNEFGLASKSAPIELMTALYTLWSEVFEKRAPTHELLRLGKDWLAFQKEIQSLIPSAPALSVNREFFRLSMRLIDRSRDWEEADFEILFSQVGAQLRIQAGENEFFCPASGTWPGTMSVSASALFQRLPKRLSRSTVQLRAHSDYLSFDGRSVPAKWCE